MPWSRFTDDVYEHPKVILAGPLAGWLWFCGVGYCNRFLTDGFLPSGVIRRLADVDDAPRLAQRLVEVGLWERVEGGYRVHDFEKYQPAAEDVRKTRDENARRVKAWRERQQSGRTNGRSNSVTNAVSPASPVPVPARYPDPAGDTSPQPPPQAEGEPTLTPATADDVALWERARAELTDGWLPSNVEKAHAIEPLGRDEQRALWLRAPPWARDAVSPHQVRAALVNAGDAAGKHARIVTG